MPEQIGANIAFFSPRAETLLEQWHSDSVSGELRGVIISAAMIYHEQGARRLTVYRLLGNDAKERQKLKSSPYGYGLAADIGVDELIQPGLPSMRQKIRTMPLPRGEFVVERINVLYPFGDGAKLTATYGVDGVFNKIRLEVPTGGYRKDSAVLAEWLEWGATGRHLTPRKVRV